MSSLARWCHRHRIAVVLLWIALLAGLATSAIKAGSHYSSSMSLPATESSKAMSLLQSSMPAASGDQDTVVWQVDGGAKVTDPAVEQKMNGVLRQISTSPGVASVTSPYSAQGASHISRSGTIAYATVVFDKSSQDMPKAEVQHVMDVAEHARSSTLDVQLGGNAIQNTETSVGNSGELVGVLAALLIMLLIFRSLWAAAMPIITAIMGVGTGVLGTELASHVVTLSSTATILATLVGLGVGIDYALFIVNRHRKGLMSGLSVEDAVAKAIDTSGRAVLFAGTTVVIALLGMIILRMGFVTGMAVGAAITVAMTVLTSVTLLPALLGLLELRVLSRKQRRRLKTQGPETVLESGESSGLWARWALMLQRRPYGKALVALAMIVVVAIPVLSLRLGSSDQGNDPRTTTTRQAYDLMAEGFGPGYNGPLMLVGQTSTAHDQAEFQSLATELRAQPGVAEVTAVPMKPGQSVGVITVEPMTSPQSKATSDLIGHLRGDVIPKAEAGTTLHVYVGGSTATSADFASVLVSKLPLFIAIIVGLGFLLMVLAFRSLLVPLIGVVMNLFGMAVAFGADVAVFQWGWGSEKLGAGAAGPVDAFVPVIVIAILFGLSMDYQVFLISRMHEEWQHTKDNSRSVRIGQAETGKVITAAAAIMGCVFAAFAAGGQRLIAEFGVALAVGVVMDVLVVRMVLVPALMHRFGKANWWLPGRLDRILPHLSVEGTEEEASANPALTAAVITQRVPELDERVGIHRANRE